MVFRNLLGMAPSNKSTLIISLVGIIAILFAAYFYLSIPKAHVQITGERASMLLAQLASDLKLGSGEPISTLKCTEPNGCVQGEKATQPAVIWRLYGFAGLALKANQKEALSWIAAETPYLDSFGPYANDSMLPQLFYIYGASKDPKVLARAVQTALTLPVRSRFRDPRTNSQPFFHQLKSSARMYPASLVWGLSRAAKLFSGPDKDSAFTRARDDTKVFGEDISSPEKLEKKFHDLALKIDEQVLQSRDTERTEFNILPEFRLTSSACWNVLADASLFNMTGDQSRLDSVGRFFKTSNLDRRKPSDVRMSSHQMILPCIQAIDELGDKADASLRDTRKRLIQNFILPALDAPERVLCDGTGGLLSARAQGDKPFSCHENLITASDFGWAMNLLAGQKEVYELS